jgi:hypothetical protein
MFVRLGGVVNDAGASDFVSSWDAVAEKILHSGLVDRPTSDFVTTLRRVLAAQPPDTQSRWVEVLRARLVVSREGSPCGSCGSPASLAIALGESTPATCPACGCQLQGPAEVLGHGPLDVARSMQTSGMERGADCLSVLRDSFERVSFAADKLMIVDRYLIADAIRAERRTAGSSGFRKILELAGTTGVPEIELFAGGQFEVSGRSYSPSDVVAMAQTIVNSCAIGSRVTLWIISEADGRQHMHDRWVGYSWGGNGFLSWTLGKGLGQFDGRFARADHALAKQRDSKVSSLASYLKPRATISAQL